jgi:hypothetical protein
MRVAGMASNRGVSWSVIRPAVEELRGILGDKLAASDLAQSLYSEWAA